MHAKYLHIISYPYHIIYIYHIIHQTSYDSHIISIINRTIARHITSKHTRRNGKK